jgi:hypothetical protein
LLISPAIFLEVGKILREDVGVEEWERISRLKALAKAAELITPTVVIDVIKENPPDNPVLECAVEGFPIGNEPKWSLRKLERK